jgi:O-antigen/teichoic acid export membrane protein
VAVAARGGDRFAVRPLIRVTERGRYVAADSGLGPAASLPLLESGAEVPPITRTRALGDVVVQMVGRIGNLLLGMVVVITITRTLGVSGNGEWSTLITISMITGYLVDPGLQTTALRMAAADVREQAHWLGALVSVRLATGTLAAVLCFVVSAAVATGPSMVIAGAFISATALTSPAQALAVVFQLEVRNGRTIAFVTINSLVWTAGAALVALSGGGLVAFAATFAGTSVFSTMVQAVYVWRRTPVLLQGVRRHRRQLMRVGLVVGLGSVLTIMYGKIDQILVLHYKGTDAAGLYGAAYSLLDRVQFLPGVLMTTIFPIVSAAWPANPDRAREAVQRVIGYMAVISFPALAFTISAARPLLVLMFGEQFAPAADALEVLMAAFILTCFGYVSGSLAVVVDRQQRFVLIATGGLLFNLVANVLLLPRYGYIAAAWITLATEVLVIGPGAATVLRAMHVAPDLQRLPRVFAAAAGMGVAVWLGKQLGCGIVLLGLIGAIAYPVAVFATGALTVDERAQLLQGLRRSVRT